MCGALRENIWSTCSLVEVYFDDMIYLFHIIKMYKCCQFNIDALLHFLTNDAFTHGSVTKDLIVNA